MFHFISYFIPVQKLFFQSIIWVSSVAGCTTFHKQLFFHCLIQLLCTYNVYVISKAYRFANGIGMNIIDLFAVLTDCAMTFDKWLPCPTKNVPLNSYTYFTVSVYVGSHTIRVSKAVSFCNNMFIVPWLYYNSYSSSS